MRHLRLNSESLSDWRQTQPTQPTRPGVLAWARPGVGARAGATLPNRESFSVGLEAYLQSIPAMRGNLSPERSSSPSRPQCRPLAQESLCWAQDSAHTTHEARRSGTGEVRLGDTSGDDIAEPRQLRRRPGSVLAINPCDVREPLQGQQFLPQGLSVVY